MRRRRLFRLYLVKPDRVLLAASVFFAGAGIVGTAASIRSDTPGRPFGIEIPLSVPAGVVVGWGAGVAAPWPMPVAALIAAASASRDGASAVADWVCVGLGIACIFGTLVEPVTYRAQSSPHAIRTAIALNLVSSAALIVAGLRRRPRPYAAAHD